MSDATIFSKMAGTEAMVRFVKEIERHPCLYDQRSLEYSNRELRRKTWTEIAKKYNSTVKECKDKWVKIRIAYVRTLRPGYNKERPRNPRSTYYLADHLQFITPGKNNSSNYSKSSLYSAENNHQLDEASEIDTKSNIVDEPLNDSDDKSDSKQYGNSQHQVFLDVDNNYFDDSKEYENSQDQVFLDEDNDYYDDGDETNDDTEINTKEIIINEINKTKVKGAINTSDNSGRIAKKRPCCDNIECSPRKMFLLSLLPDVETFTETQMRSFRRHVIGFIDNVMDE